jgi:putative sigma-54 modulation protein
MQIHITARHIELTHALADYVQKRFERVGRHFEAVLRAQVILTVEKHRHIAEVVAHAEGHHDFRAKETAGDLYAAVDLLVEKFHKHMAREKDRRVRGRRSAKATKGKVPVESAPDIPVVSAPVISRVSRLTPKSMTLAQAARELADSDMDFLMFLDGADAKILYRLRDKTYGLLEPNL